MAADDAPTLSPVRPALRLRLHAFAREAGLVLVFYYVYRTVQRLGKAGGVEPRAYANAKRVVAIERFAHVFVEQSIQQAFLGARWFIKLINIYYGSLHFVVTVGALAWLFFARPGHYLHSRNLLGTTTALALIGYYAIPLTPPRLLLCNDTIPAPAPSRTPLIGRCFVDTMERFGGFWSYQSEQVKAMANEFAAMPSLHFAWSLWCALTMYPRVRTRWAKLLWVAYPLLTLFAIVVTANHYFLDAVGGALTLWAAAVVLPRIDARRARRFAARAA